MKAEKFFSGSNLFLFRFTSQLNYSFSLGYSSVSRELTAEEVFTADEFAAVFKDIGTRIQPTSGSIFFPFLQCLEAPNVLFFVVFKSLI